MAKDGPVEEQMAEGGDQWRIKWLKMGPVAEQMAEDGNEWRSKWLKMGTSGGANG
jgi:hypothetical protein